MHCYEGRNESNIFNKQVSLFKNVRTKEEFVSICKNFGSILHQKDDFDNSGSVEISTRLNLDKLAYQNVELFPHTDRSSTDNPPDFVAMWFEKTAKKGGETTLFFPDDHLLKDIDNLNFCAKFSSENDSNNKYLPFYDHSRDFFRFRNDDHISVKKEDEEKFNEVTNIIRENTVKVKTQCGDCLILSNKSVFHGRSSFIGDRVIHRVLIRNYDE
ncbi:TauD/TfdA family dioxygenase [Piscirickettsia litoralis]|uniref:TauD/TfdA-like domain-containing protein n=1 Tax=Piscirickettsia litoralis TaxID=1891921 RepID=A0ABX2ZYA3_9GAMM|nr:TauD/TfdA family dioxygenase [Piscirickettsia litoralis]ODN41208.1 hypothetical protein BGC07_17495 [Piscirickettsia litoralis]